MKTVMNKSGYKHTPLGWIPEDWEVKELGEILSFKNGINATKEAYGNGTKFINVMEVIYNEQITANIIPGSVKITEKQKAEYVVRNGDILFNRTSETTDEIGLAAVYSGDEEVVYGGFVIRGREKYPTINNDFKRYCFRSQLVRNLIIKGGQGVVRSNIGQGDLQKVIVPLPPLPEQHHIATILSTWDAAIAKEQQLIDALQTRHRALMQQLLSGKKRLKGFKGEWKEERIEELFNEINDINDGQEHPAMTISARHGLILQQEKFDRIIAGDSLNKYTLLQRGDFAYNKGNSKLYEMGCVYQLDKSDSALVPFVYICFRPTALIEPHFYKHWFMAHGLDKQLKKIITSGARGDGLLNVNTEDFFKLKIPFPIKEEQTAIANILSTSEKEIQTHRRRLNALQQQKKGLMQVLLTGKVRVKI